MMKKFSISAIVLLLIFVQAENAFAAGSNSIKKLIISTSTVVGPSGSNFTTQPEITVADNSEDPVRDSGNTISVAISGGVGGTLSGSTTAVTNNRGKASFSNLGITGTPGQTYTLRYSYSTFTVSENITIPLNTALTPSFGTYTRTNGGFTVVITNYDTNFTWNGSATNGGSVSFSGSTNNGLATITGLGAGVSSVATITTSRSTYNNGSSVTSSTSSLNAALTPNFGTYTPTSSGFTVTITNYNTSYTWAGSATNGGSVAISGSTNNGLVTVTGMSAGSPSQVTVTTTRTGYISGSSTSASTSALLAGLTPTFGTYTRTADGFTVAITNYDSAYSWSGSATNSGSVTFSGSNGNGLATITGVASNTASIATISTSRSGYANGSAATASTTSLIGGLSSTFGAATSNYGGFGFNITNYNSAYTYNVASSVGTVALGTASGSTLPITVTGLSSGQSATVSITTSRTNYSSRTTTKTANAKTSELTPSTGNPGAWNSSATSDDGTYIAFAGSKSKLFISPNNGTDWYSSGSSLSWTSVAISSNGQKMIAGALNSKLFYSNDYGVTWNSKGSARNWRAVAMNSDASIIYGAVINGFIYKSTNSGSSWTQVGSNLNWRAIATSQNGNIVVAAAFNGNIYTSANAGVTWTSRDAVRKWSAVSISDDGAVMTATVGNGGIYISTDTGATWTALSGIESKNWNAISCDSTCSTFAVTNVSGNLFLLNNQGAKIADANTLSKWTSVSLNSAGTQVVAGAVTGSMRRSIDSGANWSLLTRIAL